MGEQLGSGRSKGSGWKRPLVIALIVIAAVPVLGGCALAALTVVTVVGALHPFAANAADEKIKPFETALEKTGGTKLCSNGDAGYGPDNLVPWSTAYYLVPEAVGISGILRQTAARQGYTLTPLVNQGDQSPMPDEAYRSDDLVRIAIYRHADVPLYCDDVQKYGEKRHVGGNDAIVEVDIQLPAHPIG